MITKTETGNYEFTYNGQTYTRYVDFGDMPYFISSANIGHAETNEKLEQEFQIELKTKGREKKLKRILGNDNI